MTDGRTDRRTDGRTDGGDCNIPDAFLKKRGDKKDRPQDSPLGDAWGNWNGVRCFPFQNNSLGSLVQEIRNPLKCIVVDPIIIKFVKEMSM